MILASTAATVSRLRGSRKSLGADAGFEFVAVAHAGRQLRVADHASSGSLRQRRRTVRDALSAARDSAGRDLAAFAISRAGVSTAPPVLVVLQLGYAPQAIEAVAERGDVALRLTRQPRAEHGREHDDHDREPSPRCHCASVTRALSLRNADARVGVRIEWHVLLALTVGASRLRRVGREPAPLATRAVEAQPAAPWAAGRDRIGVAGIADLHPPRRLRRADSASCHRHQRRHHPSHGASLSRPLALRNAPRFAAGVAC